MKAWRHVLWDKQGITWGRPSVYLMSVLLIKAYQTSKHKSPARYIHIIYVTINYTSIFIIICSIKNKLHNLIRSSKRKAV